MAKSRRRAKVHLSYIPVPRVQRSDGWTPEAQIGFIEALAASGCITEASKAVGMSRGSAYRLRADPAAASFRIAWEAALDHAVRRITDAAYARALNGVVTPIFYKGEQVGERVRHDERLVMFLLRHRDPLRYGHADEKHASGDHLESAAARLGEALVSVEHDAVAAELELERRTDVVEALGFAGDAESNPAPSDPNRSNPDFSDHDPPPLEKHDSSGDVVSLSSLSVHGMNDTT